MNLNKLMNDPIEQWQERTRELASPELWTVNVIPEPELWGQLSTEEQQRMLPKMDMVCKLTKYMLAGMVKGTIKYTSDDLTPEQWMAHLISEGADQANYQILLFDSWLKEKAEEMDAAITRSRKAWEDK